MGKLDHLPGVFITGTDTEIGKTYVSSLIIRELRKKKIDAVGLKPVCSGSRKDAQALYLANEEVLDLDVVNPWCFRAPLAPLTAGRIEGESLQLDKVVSQINHVRANHQFTLIEGVGGWMVPMGEGFGIAEFAKELALPIVVVVGNRLGAINHTLLTVEAILAARLECLGVILNYPQAERDLAATTNRLILEELCSVPILGEVITDATEIEWNDC
jgi:dethiobiotin synthetase